MIEPRSTQVARIRRVGLRVTELEAELIRAEQRGAAIVAGAHVPPGCLAARAFEYLSTHPATVATLASALGARVHQTDRAVRRLRSLGRVVEVRRVDSPKKFGVLVAEYGTKP